ncbi:MAG TPA: DUF4390 domain-containing protein, partial [Candidatus Eisenbacteria bacterium]|nr:DUF4390 domain-containing protein [Candidatus Eisenbacteria bacterium]
MLPARRRLTLPRPLVAGAIAVLCAIAPARAFDLDAASPARDAGGQLWVTVRISDPLEARVEESLARGMPATLQLHAELWRRRTAWFDRMEQAFDASMRLRYDVWTNAWLLERAGARPLVTGTLDSLELALARPIALPVATLGRLPPDARCYVVVTATLQPLKVEDVEEVEGWLSGEVQEKSHAGFGVITGLPRSLFDAVRNFAGFGDLRARIQTPDFTPATLPVVKR